MDAIIQHSLRFVCIGIYYKLAVHPINKVLNDCLFFRLDPKSYRYQIFLFLGYHALPL
jgi:hypothetical protein